MIISLNSPEATAAARCGPKASNLAVLGQAGLPVPEGFCLAADAYRAQLEALDLESTARGVFAAEDAHARQCALRMRLALLEQPIVPQVLEPLRAAWRELSTRTGALLVARSSALVEDRDGSSFAGQFESFLGIEDEADFLTAVRACWAALWAPRVLRYMATHNTDPADTAMAVLVQPLVAARAAGGGLSRTSDGGMLVNATPGLGAAIAQGEVAPDRYELDGSGSLLASHAAHEYQPVAGCVHRPLAAPARRSSPCLAPAQVEELGRIMRKAETVMGMPVEIEWALGGAGIKLLQARPLQGQRGTQHVPDDSWLRQPKLRGQPTGVGWGTGRARVVNCECEISRIAPGDVLVTRTAGPALINVLQLVAGVVAELGGSTSHLASLARERGVPMVLGVPNATTNIPDGAQVAVDGVAGIVRWME